MAVESDDSPGSMRVKKTHSSWQLCIQLMGAGKRTASNESAIKHSFSDSVWKDDNN